MTSLRSNLFSLAFAAAALPAYCSTVAIQSFSNSDVAGHSNFDLAGYVFNTATEIDITSLGMYVSGSSLADAHAIAVYSSTGALEFSANVNSGATPDSSGFTWVSVGDELLAAGNYFIGVQYNQGSADQMYDGTGTITMAGGLAFENAEVYYSGSSPIDLSDPASNSGLFTQGLPRDSYIGPNFQFIALPEPGTWGMLALGAAAILFRRRRAHPCED